VEPCIVCGVDDSSEAREAAGVAAALAAALGARLVLAHVVPLSGSATLRPVSWVRTPEFHGAFRERVAREADALLAEVADDAGLSQATERLATVGDPAHGLAQIAASLEATMIVVGSRGHGSVRSAVIGSVSSQLVSAAPCPVVVVAPGTGAGLEPPAGRGVGAAAAPIDVSRPIHGEMETYPGDPEVRIERALAIAAGDPANVTRLEMGAHTGTHVDAPVHFIEGAAGVEGLPLEALVGPVQVVDARGHRGELDAAALDALAPRDAVERLVFATSPGTELAADAARLLVGRGVRLVGIDQLSIGGAETHRVLLGAGVVILEGLDLGGAPAGSHRLVCLPLRVPGADGAPARVILEPARR
jgi:arylformamidase